MDVKTCSACGQSKPATGEHFAAHARGRFGLHSQCRPCKAIKQKQRYHADRDKALSIASKHRLRHAERIKQNEKRRIEARRQAKERPSLTGWRTCPRCGVTKPLDYEHWHAETARKNGHSVYCKECATGILRDWRAKNGDSVRSQQQRVRAKRAADISKRLHHAMGVAVRGSLRRGSKQGCSWETLVGYSVDDLRMHLERQFSRSMTWDNYGKHWHIDHIQPVRIFEIEIHCDPAFRACWALTNLRPLTAKQNLRKNGRRTLLL